MTYLLPACALAAVLVGYVVGRVRPALSLANWATRKAYVLRTGARWRAVCEHAMPHLQLDLAASGYPHAKNGHFELAEDRTAGHFVWLDLAERGTRFCAARITTQAA